MDIFDRGLLLQKRARIRSEHNFLRSHIEASLHERLNDISRNFENGLIISAQDFGKPILNQKIQNQDYVRYQDPTIDPAIGPQLLADRKSDIVISVFDLHTMNDVPGALMQIRHSLRDDGLFLGAFPGGQTLFELRHAMMNAEMALYGGVSPRIMPFMDKQDAGALLQRAQFALPVIDSENIIVSYSDPMKLLYDLRYMGESNIINQRPRKPVTKQFFQKVCDEYQSLYGQDGKVAATFEILYMTAWAPHESQQKPLKPGSGQIHLSDALDILSTRTNC
jgi:NADH dehydrogenase [ubiquinone] 1 alpha subcomplex assembly factor 5